MRTTQRDTSELVRRRMAVLAAPGEFDPLGAGVGSVPEPGPEDLDWAAAGAAGVSGAYRAPEPPLDGTAPVDAASLGTPGTPGVGALGPPGAVGGVGGGRVAGLAAPSAGGASPGVLRAPGGRPGRGRIARLRLAVRERADLDRRALAGLAVLVLLGSGYAVQRFWLGRPEPVPVPAAETAVGAGASGAATPGPRGVAPPVGAASFALGGPSAAVSPVVDVAGKVRRPGLVRLPPGARVQDALLAAGGELPGTDVIGLNLARHVVDGEQIVVGVTPPPAPGAVPGSSSQAPLSLNSATAEQLEALPGIGPTLAQRIIRYRTEHGGFTSVDELQRVSGFGVRRLRDLRDGLRP